MIKEQFQKYYLIPQAYEYKKINLKFFMPSLLANML